MSKIIKNNAILKYNENQEIQTCDVSTIIEGGMQAQKRAITASNGVIAAENGESNLSGTVGQDRTIIYEIQLLNYSSKSFNNIVVTDIINMPAPYATSFTVVDSNTPYTLTSPNIVFNVPELESESNYIIRYTIKLDDTVPVNTVVGNGASITYDEIPSDDPLVTENVDVTVDYTETTFTAEKTAPSSVIEGEEYSYEITFNNTGDQTGSPTSIEDQLPEGFTVSSVTVSVNGVNKTIIEDYTQSIENNKLIITPVENGLDIPAGQTLKVIIKGAATITTP